MALVNPNIALGARLPEFQPRNALADFAQIQQIQGGRQAQELNALKMQEAQAAMQERNALRQLNPTAEDYESQLFRVSPQLGIQYRKERSAADASAAAASASKASAQSSQATAAAARKKIFQQAQRDISGRPSDANITSHMEDVLESDLFNEQEKAEVVRNTNRLLSIPLAERGAYLASQGATAGELKPSLQQINRSGQTDLLRVSPFSGAASTVGTFADVPLPAAVVAQKKEIAQAGKPVTNITNVQEKAEAGEFGKLLVGQFDAISKQASVAARTLPSIEANLATLNKGLDTGFGTDAKAAGARVLGALGVKDAEKFATDTQTFQSNAISAVLQKQLEQKGPQTESDARRIEQIGAELGKTKDANRFILDLAREQLRRDIEQRNFYTEWKKGPGKGSFNGAEDAWFAGEGGKSLFDRPALKKYAVGAASPAAQIPGNRPAPAPTAPNAAQERAAANAAIAAGAPAAAVRARFKQNTGQEL
jgi:hypothetical protein